MTTTALSLNKILATVSRVGNNDEKFANVVAEILKIESDDTAPKVAAFMYGLVKRIERDIEDLPFDETSLNLARSQIGAFASLITFGAYNMTMQQAKQSFLRDANLTGLTHLHMTLDGVRDFTDIDKTTKELAQTYRDMCEEVQELNLPDQVKKLLIKRSLQIASILEHYYFYGAENLQSELVSLTGEIVLNKEVIEAETSFYEKITHAVGKTFKGAAAANKGIDTTMELLSKADNIFDKLN